MSNELSFHNVCRGALPEIDVVFVHGLTGDPLETWTPIGAPPKQYWPRWFCDEFEAVAVHTLGYPAAVFGKWAKKEMDLYERAGNALECLASYGIGQRPIVFVTHSLGGLLTKQMLRTANEASDGGWKAILEQVRLVAFVATPHSGASFGGVLASFAKPFTTRNVRALTDDCSTLDELNQFYRDYAPGAGIRTLAYYEKFAHKRKHCCRFKKRAPVFTTPGQSRLTRIMSVSANLPMQTPSYIGVSVGILMRSSRVVSLTDRLMDARYSATMIIL